MSNVLNDPQSQTTANWVRAVNWLYPFTKVVEASLRSLLKREDFLSVALVCIPGISAQAAQGFPLAFFATLCSPMRQLMQRDKHSRAFAAWVNFDAAWAETPGMQTGA